MPTPQEQSSERMTLWTEVALASAFGLAIRRSFHGSSRWLPIASDIAIQQDYHTLSLTLNSSSADCLHSLAGGGGADTSSVCMS